MTPATSTATIASAAFRIALTLSAIFARLFSLVAVGRLRSRRLRRRRLGFGFRLGFVVALIAIRGSIVH